MNSTEKFLQPTVFSCDLTNNCWTYNGQKNGVSPVVATFYFPNITHFAMSGSQYASGLNLECKIDTIFV